MLELSADQVAAIAPDPAAVAAGRRLASPSLWRDPGKSERAPAEEYEYVALDRDQDSALSVANGFDLVIDVIPFEAAHAKQLLGLDTDALIEAVEKAARESGASRVHWLTKEDNHSARALYDALAERSGFIQYRKLF